MADNDNPANPPRPRRPSVQIPGARSISRATETSEDFASQGVVRLGRRIPLRRGSVRFVSEAFSAPQGPRPPPPPRDAVSAPITEDPATRPSDRRSRPRRADTQQPPRDAVGISRTQRPPGCPSNRTATQSPRGVLDEPGAPRPLGPTSTRVVAQLPGAGPHLSDEMFSDPAPTQTVTRRPRSGVHLSDRRHRDPNPARTDSHLRRGVVDVAATPNAERVTGSLSRAAAARQFSRGVGRPPVVPRNANLRGGDASPPPQPPAGPSSEHPRREQARSRTSRERSDRPPNPPWR